MIKKKEGIFLKYLFFDIECSNCFDGKGKICEFGYVLTDENFHVLKKDEFPISPGQNNRNNCFDVEILKRDPTFQWAYDYDCYFNSEEFPYFYPSIKKLFEDKNTKVFGFSASNDIRYLGYAFKRYHLQPYQYKVLDIQILVKHYLKNNENLGLQSAFKTLCSEHELKTLQPHLSRDDAYMSMRVLEELLKKMNLSLADAIQQCPNCSYDANEYLENFHQQKLLEQRKRMGRKIWKNFIRSRQSLYKKGKIDIDKRIVISDEIKTNQEELTRILDIIKERSFLPVKSATESDIWVLLNEEEREKVLQHLHFPYQGEILILSEFIDSSEKVKQ